MKVTVLEDFTIQLEEVFNSIVLKTEDGEEMTICMRDSGFEFKYQGEWYFAKEGYVEPFRKSIRDNYLVEQKHDGSLDSFPQCEDNNINNQSEYIEKMIKDNNDSK